jgi:hypothetical protein
MTAEGDLATRGVGVEGQVEALTPEKLATQTTLKFREYLAGTEFSSPKARAFRDFKDVIVASYCERGFIKSEDFPDPKVGLALVLERMHSKINDDQEYAFAVTDMTGLYPNFDFDTKDEIKAFALDVCKQLRNLKEELYYQRPEVQQPSETKVIIW